MKIIYFFCFIFYQLMANSCKSQDTTGNYFVLNEKAFECYNQKKYIASAKLFSAAFDLAYKDYKGYADLRWEAAYNAACAWALAGQLDSAFVQLYKIASEGRISDYDLLTSDSDLITLRDDKRWKEIFDLVKINQKKSEANLDTTLVAKLKIIRKEDQEYRFRLDSVRNKDEKEKLWEIIGQKDSTNLLQIEMILNKYGWLGPDKVGFLGTQTLFLVIQHAPLKIQEHYLPMMQAAVKKGDALAKDLAFLEDRIALRQGKKQLYGSQLFTDETGVYVQPLEDPDNLEKRRASVWLEPMSEYIGKKWDPVEYKQLLPEIEAKMKARKKDNN